MTELAISIRIHVDNTHYDTKIGTFLFAKSKLRLLISDGTEEERRREESSPPSIIFSAPSLPIPNTAPCGQNFPAFPLFASSSTVLLFGTLLMHSRRLHLLYSSQRFTAQTMLDRHHRHGRGEQLFLFQHRP